MAHTVRHLILILTHTLISFRSMAIMIQHIKTWINIGKILSYCFTGVRRCSLAKTHPTFKENFMLQSSLQPFRQALQSLAAVALMSVMCSSPAAAQDTTLRVGVTAGPHAQIGEVVKQVAEKQGLDLRLIEFNDFIQPNAALDAGDIDLNIYQHLPFLESQNSTRGYKLAPVGDAVVQLMGIYSKKHSSIDEIPEGGRIAIPNDPTNGARALLVLQDAGLIKLKDGVTVTASPSISSKTPRSLNSPKLKQLNCHTHWQM